MITFFFDFDSVEERFGTDVWEPVAPLPGTGRDFTHHRTGTCTPPTSPTPSGGFWTATSRISRPWPTPPAIRDVVRDFLSRYTPA